MSKDNNVKDIGNKRRKKSSKKTASQPVVRKMPFLNSSSIERENAMREINEIPTFDLAEQIMAEHRKVTAVKRKGPGKLARPPKKQHPAELVARNVVPGAVSGPEQVIAEIVARDIENLCIGNISSVS